jgi:hypothetical protein
LGDVVALLSTKLLNISTIASRDSWQFKKDTVLANTIWHRLSEFAPDAKVVVKSEPELVVIDAVDNAGIEFRDVQF